MMLYPTQNLQYSLNHLFKQKNQDHTRSRKTQIFLPPKTLNPNLARFGQIMWEFEGKCDGCVGGCGRDAFCGRFEVFGDSS